MPPALRPTPQDPPDSAAAILAWLERYASHIDFQNLRPGSRQKNRVILQYRLRHTGEPKVVGGCSLAGAVFKARVRQAATLSFQKAS